MSDSALHRPSYSFSIPDDLPLPDHAPAAAAAPKSFLGSGEVGELAAQARHFDVVESLPDAFEASFRTPATTKAPDGQWWLEAAEGPGAVPMLAPVEALVTDTEVYPYRVIAYLEIQDQLGTRWRGTAALVAERTLITAGHNLYFHDRGGWAAGIRVMPGRNGDWAPYGVYESTSFASVTGWTEGKDLNYDYGAIFLDEPIGSSLGWFGLHEPSEQELSQLSASLSGYPNADGTQVNGEGDVDNFNALRLYYTIPTAVGQSGSPLWLGDDILISAIHTYQSGALNSGVRVSSSVHQTIDGWRI